MRQRHFLVISTIIFFCASFLLLYNLDLRKLRVLKTIVPNLKYGKVPYYLNNEKICYRRTSNEKYDKDTVKVVQLITSYAGNTELRKQIRKSIPHEELVRLQVRRVFLLAKINGAYQSSQYKNISQSDLDQEFQQFGDIIIGDFIEAYKNLTYKHIMGLTWAAKFCPHAKFIVKQDDDVVFDIYQFLQLIDGVLKPNNIFHSSKENVILGKLLEKQPIIRDKNSKWFVPRHIFENEKIYPPFVSGWGYITTNRAVNAILKVIEEKSVPFFEIDDVFITGILREEANVGLEDIAEYFTVFKGHLHCCVAIGRKLSGNLKGPYWCDFIIGPSMNDLSFIDVFYKHAQFCYTTGICIRRPKQLSLKNTCVVTDNMILT